MNWQRHEVLGALLAEEGAHLFFVALKLCPDQEAKGSTSHRYHL